VPRAGSQACSVLSHCCIGSPPSPTSRLRCFDIVEWNALDLRDRGQAERRGALEMVDTSAVGESELVTLAEYATD
jgi:hypothetical protein